MSTLMVPLNFVLAMAVRAPSGQAWSNVIAGCRPARPSVARSAAVHVVDVRRPVQHRKPDEEPVLQKEVAPFVVDLCRFSFCIVCSIRWPGFR